MHHDVLNMELINLIVNAALCVLIWIVQLVIYPGFTHYREEGIKKWHPIYARRITYIVMPLMLSQLLLYITASYQQPSIGSVLILVLIILVWMVTFLMAVPLHNDIDSQSDSIVPRNKLVRINWIRTIIWTGILIISLLNYGK
jgi:hypothetical protein